VCAERGITREQLDAERCAIAEQIISELKAEGRWAHAS
jgi:hypothetical protein